MAKKRKASGRFNNAGAADGFESKGGKMAPITTYEDVADSEDEFHINQDKVLLEDGPDAKRRRKYQEEGDILSGTYIWYDTDRIVQTQSSRRRTRKS